MLDKKIINEIKRLLQLKNFIIKNCDTDSRKTRIFLNEEKDFCEIIEAKRLPNLCEEKTILFALSDNEDLQNYRNTLYSDIDNFEFSIEEKYKILNKYVLAENVLDFIIDFFGYDNEIADKILFHKSGYKDYLQFIDSEILKTYIM